jgi:hypothetical protein
VTFNYLSSEWSMDGPFQCLCGEAQCFGYINGYRNVPKAQRHLMSHVATSYVQGMETKEVPRAAPKDYTSGSIIFEGVTDYYLTKNHVQFKNGISMTHSCAPNCVVVEGHILCAEQPVGKDTLLTVNFSLFNYTIEDSFTCDCGATACQGKVLGFAALSQAEQCRLMHLTEPNVRKAVSDNGDAILSSSDFIVVKPNGNMGEATFAKLAIAEGTRVFDGTGLVIPFATVYTINVALGRHLLFANGGQCLAHCCDPNVKIVCDDAGFHCVALRAIHEGELISFNYLTTEYEMNSPFDCLCGSPKCFGHINGFKNVAVDRRADLLAHITAPVAHLDAAAQKPRSATRALTPGCNVFEGTRHFSLEKNLVHFTNGVTLTHSCAPNCVVVEGRTVCAHKPVAEGTLLTANFNLFNYEVATPFACDCGAAECVKQVSGFQGLKEEIKQAQLYLSEPDVRATAMNKGWIVASTNPKMVIRPNGGMGQTAYACADIAEGVTLFENDKDVLNILDRCTLYTICCGQDKHVLFGQGSECISHSCNPNVKVVIVENGFHFVTVRPIKDGEIVTFNYLSSEWSMDGPFQCLCGEAQCFGYINGYRNVPKAQRHLMSHVATSYVQGMETKE